MLDPSQLPQGDCSRARSRCGRGASTAEAMTAGGWDPLVCHCLMLHRRLSHGCLLIMGVGWIGVVCYILSPDYHWVAAISMSRTKQFCLLSYWCLALGDGG